MALKTKTFLALLFACFCFGGFAAAANAAPLTDGEAIYQTYNASRGDADGKAAYIAGPGCGYSYGRGSGTVTQRLNSQHFYTHYRHEFWLCGGRLLYVEYDAGVYKNPTSGGFTVFHGAEWGRVHWWNTP